MIFQFFIDQRERRLVFLKWKSDQPLYRLVEPVTFIRADNSTLIVPIGTVTDGASVPWMLRWIFPQQGRYTRASLGHDYLYETDTGTREDADWDFFAWMLKDDVPGWKAFVFYLAVRIGGKRWWTKK
jgi:hypothetical protein